jgi:hypothetical protein
MKIRRKLKVRNQKNCNFSVEEGGKTVVKEMG